MKRRCMLSSAWSVVEQVDEIGLDPGRHACDLDAWLGWQKAVVSPPRRHLRKPAKRFQHVSSPVRNAAAASCTTINSPKQSSWACSNDVDPKVRLTVLLRIADGNTAMRYRVTTSRHWCLRFKATESCWTLGPRLRRPIPSARRGTQ